MNKDNERFFIIQNTLCNSIDPINSFIFFLTITLFRSLCNSQTTWPYLTETLNKYSPLCNIYQWLDIFTCHFHPQSHRLPSFIFTFIHRPVPGTIFTVRIFILIFLKNHLLLNIFSFFFLGFTLFYKWFSCIDSP